MSLLKKSKTLPAASEPEKKDTETGTNRAPKAGSGGTTIERWNALLEHDKVPADKRQPEKVTGKAQRQKQMAMKQQPVQSSTDEGALPQNASTQSTASSTAPQQRARGTAARATDRGARASKTGYRVNYNMSYGSQAKSKTPPANDLSSRQQERATGTESERPPAPSGQDPDKVDQAAKIGAPSPDAGTASNVAEKGSSGTDASERKPERQPRLEPAVAEASSSDAQAPDIGQDWKSANAKPGESREEDERNSEKVKDSQSLAANDAAEPNPASGSETGTATDPTEIADEKRLESPEIAEKSRSKFIPPTSHSDDMSYTHYGRSIFFGMLLLVVGIGGFVTWASLAPLSAGVIASGTVKLQGDRKTVQHLEGGIIRELLVSEGQAVKEGQVLIRLDGSRAEAMLDVQSSEYYALMAKSNRLHSERLDLGEVKFSPVLLDKADEPDIAALLESERILFADRMTNLQDQLKIFSSWVEGYRREIKGLEAQKTAAEKQIVHIKDELRSVETLYKKGLVAKPRLLELKRTAAGLTGEIGSLTASVARTEQKIGEAALRGISLQTERAEAVSNEIAQVENSMRRLKEQLPAHRDVVERLEIRAPRSGRVVDLRFHTSGGVISPSTPILDIVPKDATLLIEARINPVDIDVLEPGMPANITLTAYSQRKTPPVSGRLLQVSADRIDDPKTGEAYYQAMVEIDSDALGKLGNVKLYPGMPASVQLVSGKRTPMDYLLSPIQAGLRNSWLEE